MIRKLSRIIGIRTNFVGFHFWKDAPDEVGFLQDCHRHVFNVVVELPVTSPARQIEFFTARKQIDTFITQNFLCKIFEHSCEELAEKIGTFVLECFDVPSCTVRVQEDEENYGQLSLLKKEDE